MLRTLPAYFHPTTLLFVDDDGFLLDSMQDSLHLKFNIKKFTSGVDAFSFIQLYKKDPDLKPCVERAIQYSQDFVIEEKRPTILNLSLMMNHLLNPKRFNTVSVTIVDFAMPAMTGVEFLDKINDFDCKKMMFTGEAWNIDGLNLFNLNSIDRICRKSEPALAMTAIFEDMQLRYFQDHTQILLNALKNLSLVTPQCLLDPDLTFPVMELFRSKGIVEFYLINHEGFFVTATASGALGLFILQSESEKSASLHDSIKTETQTYYYSFQELPEEQKISLKNVLGFDRLGE
jgi:hypothetical protein